MKRIIYLLFGIIALNGCIGDDYLMDAIDPELRILNAPDSLEIGTDYAFEAMYLNNVGQTEDVDLVWTSSDPSVISINNGGFADALQLGTAIITASYEEDTIMLMDAATVGVGEVTVNTATERIGSISTTSSYALSGDFILTEEGNDLKLEFAENYNASTALPGLYIYLTNNPNSTANAYEIGAVQIFSGAHSYTIPNASLFDYSHVLYFCKPFGVKVGDGQIQ